jgi:hypothetical protein
LSISAIKPKKQNWQLKKTVLVYYVLAATAIAVNYIYAIFGHGVHAPAMTWMFLYPLIGGALVYFLIAKLIPAVSNVTGYRLFYNLYNSGIATLTVASLLKGILDIAGTNSVYTGVFYVGGIILVVAGLVVFVFKPLKQII